MKKNWIKIVGLGVLSLSLVSCSSEKSAKDYYKDGVKCLENGNYAEASGYMLKAIEMNTDKAEYYIGSAMSLTKLGKYEEAIKQYDRIIMDKDNQIAKENNKRAYRGKGIAYYEKGDYEKAIEEFQRALKMGELSSYNADIRRYLADCYMQKGEYKEALTIINELITEKEAADDYAKRAEIQYLSGDTKKAVEDYNKAIEMNAKNIEFYLEKYELLLSMDNEEEAQKCLAEALKMEATSPSEKYDQARVYLYQKDYDKAGQILKEIVKDYPQAYYLLGEVYYAKDDSKNAISNYNKYLESSHKEFESQACYKLSGSYIRKKDYKKALEYVEKGLAAGTKVQQGLLYNQVICKEYLGDFKEAYELAKEYNKKYPSDEKMNRELIFLKSRT